MGWFDGRSSSGSHYVVRRRSPSRRSTSGIYSSHHARHSAPSIFNFGGLGHHHNRSTGSFFSSSSRRARPRSGFIQRMIHSIKRLFRDIYHYARRNPIKVFLLVIVPLLTSGVLAKLLAVVGIRLPSNLAGPPRGGYGGNSPPGLGDSVNSLMNIAKMFV
ncbi:hypothetical protein PVAR5_5005 [Paecilomyces variotii No. 5]|uniref:Uncharacterized protein n=1 Tax=Byssochlamys spectabilis (strain No. 5 / NBRC 109023) TaxID=1356009 RepID=V5G657_BYSSN|nr:hypothetical protein PVAR5_5005 [Paecilomyces variotii No. 5]